MSVPAAYLGVIVIWSTTPLAIQWSSEGGGFLFGVSARILLGALLCLAVMGALSVPLPRHRNAIKTYVAAGTGIYGAMMLVYWGAQYIPSGLVAVLFGLTPIVTGILAGLVFQERLLDGARLTGTVLGLSGLLVIYAGQEQLGPAAGAGVAAVLASVCLHAVSAITVKRIGADVSAMATAGGGLLVAAVFYLVTWLLAGERLPDHLTSRATLSIFYLAVMGSVLGFVLYYYVLQRVTVMRIALITLVTPVMALLLGYVLNDEPVALRVWGGAGLIIAGLLVFESGAGLRGAVFRRVAK